MWDAVFSSQTLRRDRRASRISRLRRRNRCPRSGKKTLVSYGTAAFKNDSGSVQTAFLSLFSQLWMWHLSPNNRGARFYNFWAGERKTAVFRERLREDLTAVFALLTEGVLAPQIAATFPLHRAAEALALAESRTQAGKVILTPDPPAGAS